jgi:hypothetical protein
MGVNRAIDEFFAAVDQEIEAIDRLPSDRHGNLLMFSLMEMLAGRRFTQQRRNGERFVKLIDDYSEWADRDRVSLVRLLGLIDRRGPSIELTRLAASARGTIDGLTWARIYPASEVDPFVSEVQCSGTAHDGEARSLIEKARYAPLLWQMRNCLVHELRAPGRGIPLSKHKNTPFYHSVTVLGDKEEFLWELYIPRQVISAVARGCAQNLKKWFTKERIDPHSIHPAGSC